MTAVISPELVPVETRLQVAHRYLSIRQLSQLTGSSFGTIQGILSGTTRAPRELTLQRIEAGLRDFPFTFETTGKAVTYVTAPVFTDDSLANLVPPVGARAVAISYYASGTGTGFASTGWQDLRQESPLDVAMRVGVPSESVARVTFDR